MADTTIIFTKNHNHKDIGLTDTLRGIVSLFHFCKMNNLKFKINFNYPFQLTRYLIPRKYNWLIDGAMIEDVEEHSIVKLFCKGEEGEIQRHRKLLQTIVNENQGRQIYIHTNTVCYDEDFSTDFKELFDKTPYLSKIICNNLSLLSESYNSVSCRFCNALGDFPDILSPLDIDIQLDMIKTFKNKVYELVEISKTLNRKLLVTSDSIKFISAISDIDNVQTISGPIVHSRNSMDMAGIDKVFVEFFLISLAKQAYSITSDGLFSGAFSYYASQLSKIKYTVIKV